MAIEDHNIRSRAARSSYQKLVREQILAILGMDNSRSSDQYILLSSLLSACAY